MLLWRATIFFPYILLLLNKGLENIYNIKCTFKRHVLYIIKIFSNIAHKRDNAQKRRGHAEQQIRATLDEESSTNKALTESIANWRHALHFTERYEHATLETNRKELNRTSRLISKLCSLFHRSIGVLVYLIQLQSHF